MHHPTLAASSIDGWDLALLFAIICVLYIAKKLPFFSRFWGKTTAEFKEAREKFERERDLWK